MPQSRSFAMRLVTALAVTAVAILIRWLLHPLLGPELPFVTLFGAVVLSAWWGGSLPALVAAGAGYLAALSLFVPPPGSPLDAGLLAGGGAYLVSCGLIVAFGATLRAAERRALAAAEDTRRHQARLLQEIVDRREAEWALRLQEEWFRVAFSSIGDGVIATDRDGRITLFNPVAQALTGWREDDARGKPLGTVFRLFDEKTREPVENPVHKVLREGRVVGLADHSVLIGRDGTERPVDDSAAPIRDQKGAIIGVVLVFRDVTEERRAEATRQRLAAIVESSDDAIIGKDLEGIVTAWNAGAERLYGYRAEDVLGKVMPPLVPPEAVNEPADVTGQIRVGGRAQHVETVRRRKDGSLVDVSITVSPICDARGAVIGVSSTARDISRQKADIAERRRAEEALRRQNARLRLLSEAAGHLLATDDPDSMVRGLFERIREHLGLDAYLNYALAEGGEELRLESSGGIPEDRTVLRLRLGEGLSGQAAERREPVEADHVQGSGDASLSVMKALGFRTVICHPLLVEGRLLGTLSFASRTRDGFAADDLEFLKTIAQYVTVAYERVRLVRELRAADRRKDVFLATLAHELRNPLAPIRNALEVMRLVGDRPPEGKGARAIIERQFRHMVRLVDDLFDLSRITRGTVELRRENVELAAVVESALETSRPLVEEAGHRVKVSLPAGPIRLHADATRLTQVFANLLNNACHHTPRGGDIRVEAARDGEAAVVTVADNGVGITPEHLPRIFETFAQGDPGQGRAGRGLGIGLSLVKALVELHGGAVAARSAGPGRGSEFVVRLPLTRAKAPARVAARVDAEGEERGRKRRILVVDDNRDSVESMALMLRYMGHEVQTAADGRAAVDAAASFHPELILLDIGMPELDGYQAARRIREQPWGRGLKLIALTGWGQAEDRRRAEDAGFDVHLTKPVDPGVLRRYLAGLP